MSRESTNSRILVTDACRGSAVATIRSLARHGYEVIAADADAYSPGLVSRFAKHRVIYACPRSSPHQFIDDILEAVNRYQIDLIVPVTERVLRPLEAARDRIDRVCKVPWAPPDAMAIVRDKNLTFQLAEQLGIRYPRTCVVNSVEEALSNGPSLGWPLVLKPRSSHTLAENGSVRVWNVDYACDDKELRERMRQFEGHCSVLLQEYFAGAGVGVEVLAHEGDVICAFQHRRLREVPLTGGASSLRRSDPLDPDLYAQTRSLISALKWTGLAMVEYKQNARGESRLMEINGRICGSLPVAVAAGVDFPVELCKLTLNGPPDKTLPVQTAYKIGVHVQDFRKELSWILRVLQGDSQHTLMKLPRRLEVFGAILDLLKPHYRFDILSLSDPMPGVRIFLNLCRSAGQSLRQRIGPQSRRNDRPDPIPLPERIDNCSTSADSRVPVVPQESRFE